MSEASTFIGLFFYFFDYIYNKLFPSVQHFSEDIHLQYVSLVVIKNDEDDISDIRSLSMTIKTQNQKFV